MSPCSDSTLFCSGAVHWAWRLLFWALHGEQVNCVGCRLVFCPPAYSPHQGRLQGQRTPKLSCPPVGWCWRHRESDGCWETLVRDAWHSDWKKRKEKADLEEVENDLSPDRQRREACQLSRKGRDP